MDDDWQPGVLERGPDRVELRVARRNAGVHVAGQMHGGDPLRAALFDLGHHLGGGGEGQRTDGEQPVVGGGELGHRAVVSAYQGGFGLGVQAAREQPGHDEGR